MSVAKSLRQRFHRPGSRPSGGSYNQEVCKQICAVVERRAKLCAAAEKKEQKRQNLWADCHRWPRTEGGHADCQMLVVKYIAIRRPMRRECMHCRQCEGTPGLRARVLSKYLSSYCSLRG